jgi:hypothetical protein
LPMSGKESGMLSRPGCSVVTAMTGRRVVAIT